MMKLLFLALASLCLIEDAMADTLVATRTIRAKSILGPADVELVATESAGEFQTLSEVVGQEARVALYAGRPILAGQIGPPAIIDRNAIVTLVFQTSGLEIFAEGRSLGRAGVGDRLRVMNLQSRQTVTGMVRADGSIIVGTNGPILHAN